jgi:hypothetical protein
LFNTLLLLEVAAQAVQTVVVFIPAVAVEAVF